MKKTIILTAAILMFVNPAIAQQARPNAGGPQYNRELAKVLNAYNRMNRANQPRVATSPGGQKRGQFGSLSSANAAFPGTSSSLMSAPVAPPGDRPFDANAPVIDPFAAARSPGSLSSPPFMPGPGVDPFGVSQSTVNPFVPSGPAAANPLAASVPDLSVGPAGNPANPVTASRDFSGFRKSPQLELHPLEGLLSMDSQFPSSPYDTLSAFGPMTFWGNLYSLDYLFRGSSSRLQTSP